MLRSCADAPEYGFRQQRVTHTHGFVVSRIRVSDQCAQPQTAVFGRLDPVQRQLRDVDQTARTRHVLLHQIDEIGAAGDELRG